MFVPRLTTMWGLLWQRCPALLLCLGALFGAIAALDPHWLLVPAFIGIFAPSVFYSRLMGLQGWQYPAMAFVVAFGTYVYASTHYVLPETAPEGVSGVAQIHRDIWKNVPRSRPLYPTR